MALFSIGVIAGCGDEIPAGREQVIDGRFAHWPLDGDQGDAWRASGDAALSVSGDNPFLTVEAPGSSHAGVETLVPVVPGETYELSFRHRGGAGRWQHTGTDDSAAETEELSASPSWRRVERTLTPTRDGVRLRFEDAPHDNDTLELDDVHLAAATEGPRTEEPPIRVLWVIHTEPDVGDAERYWARRDELVMLADLAEQTGLRLTVLLSGPQAEWAVDQDDTAFYGELQQRGHEIGTHTHPVSFVEHNHWEQGDIFADGVAHQQWGDHRAWVDQVVAPATNTTMCGYAPMALMPSLMADHGFGLDLASVAVTTPNGTSRESVAWDYLGHHPHHPYRPADTSVPGEELAGDPSAGYTTISHAAQVGRGAAHGGPALAVDYMRVFDQTVDRWTGHQRTPALAGDDQVWVFGFLHHLGEWDEHGDEVENLLQHLQDTALGHESEEGNPIAAGATASEVRAEFERWEQDHPGEAQFSFTVPP